MEEVYLLPPGGHIDRNPEREERKPYPQLQLPASKSDRKAKPFPPNDILCASLPFSFSVYNGWGGSRRSEAYRRADHQIRNWALLKDLKEAHPRALMSYGNSWLETILMGFGRNNKNQSPGWLVSLVIGDYLAWFGEHLLG